MNEAKSEQAAFRIGGVYWNGNHDIPIHVIHDLGDGWAAVCFGDDPHESYIRIRLSDGLAGRDGIAFDYRYSDYLNLIPGELTLRDGQWVPVEEAKPAVEKWPSLDAMTLLDKPFTSEVNPTPSGLTLSPDLSEAKHQVNAQHAMAADRFA